MPTVAENINELTKTEDVAHISGDKGFQLLAVRNDVLAALAGTDGDYAPLQVDASGALFVNVATGAADLGKAEDAVHASGDTGVQILAVRNDTLAALATTDGDYAPLQVDANGALFVKLASNTGVDIGDVDVLSIAAGDNNIGNVDVVTLPALAAGTNNIGDVDVLTVAAGETHVGNVGGECALTRTVMTLHTDANVSNDVLAATQVVSACLRVNDGTGIIQSIVVQDDDDNGANIDLVFMDANTSIGAESSTVSMADNDTILGIVHVATSDYVDMINSKVATMANVGIGIKGATGTDDIYLGIVARNTSTYSASGITVSIFVLND